MWVTGGIGIASHSQPMQIACRGPAELEKMEIKSGLPIPWGLGTTLISGEHLRVCVAPLKAPLQQFRYLKELQQFISVNLDPQSPPAPCCNMFTPSPSSPITGEPVEFQGKHMAGHLCRGAKRGIGCISSYCESHQMEKKRILRGNLMSKGYAIAGVQHRLMETV